MTMLDKPRHILPWMQQLADAVACIESCGYAHGDINPRNILVYGQDQLKLADLDHARKIGDDLEVGYEPYVGSTGVKPRMVACMGWPARSPNNSPWDLFSGTSPMGQSSTPTLTDRNK